MRTAPTQNIQTALIVALLFFFLLFTWQVSQFNFAFNWDDDMQILENELVRNPVKNSIFKIFSEPAAGMYQPIVTFLFKIETLLFGFNPKVYHTFSIIWHFIAILGAYLLALRLSRNNWVALIVASLLAFHPSASEPIAWISARSTLVYASFGFFGLAFWVQYLDNHKKKHVFIAILLVIVSMLSKVQGIIWPIMMVAIWWLYSKRSIKDFQKLLPFILIVPVIIWLGFKFRPSIPESENYTALLLLSGVKLIWFLKRILWFGDISAIYPPFSISIITHTTLLLWPISLVLLIKLYLIKSKFTFPLFYFLTFTTIHLIQFSIASPVADRYLYVPIFGMALILALALQKLPLKQNIAIFALIVIYYGFNFIQALPKWKEPLALWQSASNTHPDFYFAWEKLATTQAAYGDYNTALNSYSKALKLEKNSSRLYFNAAVAQFQSKNLEKAEEYYSKAISLEPTVFYYYMNLGRTLFELGKIDQAWITLQQGENLAPNDPLVQMTLGQFAAESGKTNPCPYFQKALSLGHTQAQAFLNNYCK
ncbi:tetratricopeptide repeat protein [Fulvivirgaceae bacterium LMO-SS25]